MGFFSSGSAEGPYANIPDDQLNFYQRHSKKWQSNAPFPVSSGGEYGVEAKCGVDGRLRNSLGLTNIDDLFEMKAPHLYSIFNVTSANIIELCKYIYQELPNNNKYQQLQGKHDELQKRCVAQENTIKELMEQNKALIKQNQELQAMLIPAKQASHSASFVR